MYGFFGLDICVPYIRCTFIFLNTELVLMLGLGLDKRLRIYKDVIVGCCGMQMTGTHTHKMSRDTNDQNLFDTISLVPCGISAGSKYCIVSFHQGCASCLIPHGNNN